MAQQRKPNSMEQHFRDRASKATKPDPPPCDPEPDNTIKVARRDKLGQFTPRLTNNQPGLTKPRK